MQFQWYPGHMTKAKRQMQEDIKLIDLVIELVDARIPLSSRNPDIDELGKNKARLIIMNKSDLSDENQNKEWAAYFKKMGYYVVGLDARTKTGMKTVTNVVMEACKEKIERDRRRGILNRPVRAMVVGIPNVGKSTFLSRVTNAQPKIANYHFTTLQPNLGVVDLEDGDGFVIADIPGLIEGASDGVGLGHEFLRHIERTKVIIHIVDAAGTEGRDPIADIKAIDKELEAYNPDLLKKPQVIAANKIDAIYGDENEIIAALRNEFEKDGIRVFPISAVSGQGVRELLFHVRELLAKCPKETFVYEQEFDPALQFFKDEPYTITRADDGAFVVEGPKIEKMLGYTNLESEKGYLFFQKFLREQGIIEELEKQGIEDGDTVRMYYNEFDYYK